MARPAALSQADIERAAKAVKKAGWRRARFVIEGARMQIDLSDAADTPASGNEWDRELD